MKLNQSLLTWHDVCVVTAVRWKPVGHKVSLHVCRAQLLFALVQLICKTSQERRELCGHLWTYSDILTHTETYVEDTLVMRNGLSTILFLCPELLGNQKCFLKLQFIYLLLKETSDFNSKIYIMYVFKYNNIINLHDVSI